MSDKSFVFKLKANFMTLFEKNGSVKNYEEAFEKCDIELRKAGLSLLNSQNYLLVDDLLIRIYTLNSEKNPIVFFVIFSPITNSMFFPINIEKNCPTELISLAKNILDKTICKKIKSML